jgi:hypothetical protein
MDKIQIESAEGFHEALRALKKSLAALSALESDLAAAAIAMKLVDALDSIIEHNVTRALKDVWSCVAAIQRVLYSSLSEHLSKTSKLAEKGADVFEDDHKLAAEWFILSNAEITKDTGFEILFI